MLNLGVLVKVFFKLVHIQRGLVIKIIFSSFAKCRILAFAKLNPHEKLEIRPLVKLNPCEISNFVIREIKSTRNLIHAKFNLREI